MPAQTVIKLRRDTASNWTTVNPVLAAGEAGFESDTSKLKIGDGTTAWNSLPYTGADVTNLEYVGFDTAAEVVVGVGELAWNADQETLDLGLDANVTLQIGQEHVVRVKNASASVAIPKGTLVMFAGVAGDTVTVAPAVVDGSSLAEYILGITAEPILEEAFGFVTLDGFISNIDTSAFTVGTILYGNPAVAGGLTGTKPAAPNLKLPVAAVTRSHASTGRILVRMSNGLSLEDLHSVQLTSEATGEVLQYDGTKWINSAIAIGEVTGLTTALEGKASLVHTHGMGDLTGFEITDPATGQTLQYNGTKWVNAAPAGGGETISSFLLMGA
jgi:hypothetical protein